MSLNRQKVDYNDPLSFLSGNDDQREETGGNSIQYVNEETDFRTVDLEKVQFGAGKKKKKDDKNVAADASSPISSTLPSLGPRPITPPHIETHQSPAARATAAAPAVVAVAPPAKMTKPKMEEDEDIFIVKKKVEVVEEDDDIFNFKKEVTSSSKKPQTYAPKPMAKIDFTKEDDDDVSDLNVAKLLEREEQLDYNLFGKVNTTAERQKTAKKKMDLDQESDFLKQLDEITTTSSKKLSSSASKNSSTTNDFDFQFSKQSKNTALSGDFDINSLNLDDYISQNASSGGGLFDD